MVPRRVSVTVLSACLALSFSSVTDAALHSGVGVAQDQTNTTALKPQVLTTTAPLEYLASRIANGRVRVECPVPAEADPENWKPERETIQRYQKAELVITNGAEFEKWLGWVSLSPSRLVDSSRVFASEYLRHQRVTHTHGSGGAHAHEGVDGHTWLDPLNAIRQGEQIELAMSRKWPEHQAEFRAAASKLSDDLAALHARLIKVVKPDKPIHVFANHPAYNYLARRYGWKITNLDMPTDQAPSTEQWAAVDAACKNVKGPKIMLCESQLLAATANRLSESLQVTPVVFSPAETRAPSGPDFLAVMNANVDRLQEAVASAQAAEEPAKVGKLQSPPKASHSDTSP